MCGIFALINVQNAESTKVLFDGTQIIKHRGPDDVGFYVWSGTKKSGQVYAGPDTDNSTLQAKQISILPQALPWKVGFGHRRLSIIDLSPGGHQPMVHDVTGLTITFNGEVYNYKEIRQELQQLGHHFYSHSDTEVILVAWAQWGRECVHRFNGMFAFVIFDPRTQEVFAVRDRFGVKPVYWYADGHYVGIASEPKQFKGIPSFDNSINKEIAYQYLAFGRLDYDAHTFYENIQQIRGGEMLIYSLAKAGKPEIKRWYRLPLDKRWEGSDKEAIEQFRTLFYDSVKLRLRSDVTVGSCLSGGLDSSAIVCTMAEVLAKEPNHNGIKTITACFDNKKYDEWEYAKAVIDQTHAVAHQVFPSFENLQEELGKLMWHMDEPFGSTSQYSQWAVFKGAAQAGLKVMLDGQGSDEQLAGYNGNELPLYAGLMRSLKFGTLYSEINSYKKLTGINPKSQVLGATLRTYPFLKGIMPSHLKGAGLTKPISWINERETDYFKLPLPLKLQDTLAEQTLYSSLPVLLRYEDRNSMAWSIESRVPFMDYRFVEFTMSLPEHLVFPRGTRKYILREAMRPVFPQKIYERKDKMGFVTPEEVWLKGQGKDWLYSSSEKAIQSLPELFNKPKAMSAIDAMLEGKSNFDFSYWRLACIGLWLNS